MAVQITTFRMPSLWDYFRKDKINKNSHCTICEKDRCSQCKKSKTPCILAGLYPTNAKRHLNACHEDVYKLVTENQTPNKRRYEADDENEATTAIPTSAKKSTDFFKPRALSKEKIDQQKWNFSRLIAQPSIPISLLENEAFRNCVENYNHGYTVLFYNKHE